MNLLLCNYIATIVEDHVKIVDIQIRIIWDNDRIIQDHVRIVEDHNITWSVSQLNLLLWVSECVAVGQ